MYVVVQLVKTGTKAGIRFRNQQGDLFKHIYLFIYL
uniref:Uncharacterized protein n=1 Tax=Solanum lycopersicum TaxID=4081 RepID=K4BCK4_SOLLC